MSYRERDIIGGLFDSFAARWINPEAGYTSDVVVYRLASGRGVHRGHTLRRFHRSRSSVVVDLLVVGEFLQVT